MCRWTQALLAREHTPELLLDLVAHYGARARRRHVTGRRPNARARAPRDDDDDHPDRDSPTTVIRRGGGRDARDADDDDDDADHDDDDLARETTSGDHEDESAFETAAAAAHASSSQRSPARRVAERCAEFTALLVRNLSLLRRNKGRILAQPPLVAFVLDELQDARRASAGLLAAAAAAAWALVHHSEKARVSLRADAARLSAAHTALAGRRDAKRDRPRDRPALDAAFRAITKTKQILDGDQLNEATTMPQDHHHQLPPQRR